GAGDARRLIAYLVPHPETELRVADLRARLGERLPGYMVPAQFVVLDSLPVTRNGKLHRRAPPVPGATPAGRAVAPRTPTEQRLRDLWSDLLGVPAIGAGDSFFHLGGHSLTAVRLVSRVRQRLGREISVRTVFGAPVLRDLAAAIDRSPA